MSVLKTVYKQTFIYGLATVVPRMLSFLLVRLHTDKSVLENVADYGDVSIVFAYFVLASTPTLPDGESLRDLIEQKQTNHGNYVVTE